MKTKVEDNIANNEPKGPKFPWLILAAVLALWFINLGWGIWAMDNKPSRGGEWGDIFGAVNALFSALAFLMIYYGIQMQRYEVKLAKEELKESKEQTRAQKVALDKQNEVTERQIWNSKKKSFEETFFSMLNAFTLLRDNLKWHEDEKIRGSAYFLKLLSVYRSSWPDVFDNPERQISKVDVDDFFTQTFASQKAALSTYINMVVEIIDHTNNFGSDDLIESPIIWADTEITREKFKKILLACFSDEEITILGYFIVSRLAGAATKAAISKFGFFFERIREKPSQIVSLLQKEKYLPTVRNTLLNYWKD